MGKDKNLPTRPSSERDVDAFLRKVSVTPKQGPSGLQPRGRLLFGMDATASRQLMWDSAAHTQAEMFQVTSDLGGLDVQLAFYRGFNEFKVSRWTSKPEELSRLMTSVVCRAGETQLHKILKHARNEASINKIGALVFVGDAFEEDLDAIGKTAGELGMLGVPAFMFHEGSNSLAAFAFQQVAKLTGGGYCRFDASSAGVLRQLLGAVAIYAAGGQHALVDMASSKGGEVRLLAEQISRRNKGTP